MNLANIISEMTWSYSRITTFEDCPYRFFLSYLKHLQKQPLFFSDYGKFIHKIIERYLTGALNESELISYYLSNFRREVRGAAPTSAVFKTYFEQGLQYFENMVFPYPTPLATEQRVDFLIEDKPFTGIIDCVAERDNALVVLDNKSRALKPRTARKKPTKYDEELDTYLRQLYLYCVPTKDRFHQYPDRLEINCFRTGQLISEPFREEAFEKTKEWALSTIETITNNEDWSPRLDYWKCRYLCDLNHHCEYYQLNRGWSP